METFLKNSHGRIIESFWSELTIKQSGNSNEDYGEHFLHLNFPCTSMRKKAKTDAGGITTSSSRYECWIKGDDFLPNGQPTVHDGSKTFGLVLDKQNNASSPLSPPISLSMKQKAFLDDLRGAMILHLRNVNNTNSKCLRINILKGAKTLEHTDTLRSSLLPNFFCFFPPKYNDEWTSNDLNFCLRVRNWPLFKTSFVIFRGRICIPFSFQACPPGHIFQHNKVKKTGGYLKIIQ